MNARDQFSPYDDLNTILRKDSDRRWREAANELCRMLGEKVEVATWEEGRDFIKNYFLGLLDDGMVLEAGVFGWGRSKFVPDRECVRRIMHGIRDNSRLLLQGSSSQSKSFSSICWMLLDFYRDIIYTAVRLASVSEAHLKANAWSHLLEMHKSCVIPFPELISRPLFLGIDPNIGNSCIRGVTFPKDEELTGRFIGFKPYKRDKPHPIFGEMSRTRVFLDEFNKMSPGVMTDLRSVEAGMSGKENIKIVAAYNPYDITHIAYKVAEPKQGWESVDPDEDHEWDTKRGWHLIRLDGMKAESVIARVSPMDGFLTWDGYNGFLAGGDTSIDYWCYGRGWFPMQGAANTIINHQTLLDARKVPVFSGEVTELGSVDSANIRDKTIFTKLRYGQALGCVDSQGVRHSYPRPRHVLYVEAQMEIPGCRDGWELAQKIRDMAVSLGVTPQWLVIDKTGAAEEHCNALRRVFGDILGVQCAMSATNMKILATDVELPCDHYAKIASELWFTTKRWLTAGVMLINPAIPPSPLFDQLTSRRRRLNKTEMGKAQVETKEEYRARGWSSPDAADSLSLAPFLIRSRHSVLPGEDADEEANKAVPVDPWDKYWGITPGSKRPKNHVDEQVSLEEEVSDHSFSPEKEVELEPAGTVESQW